MIQGDAAVDLGLDGIGDLLVFLADDPLPASGFFHGGGLIGDHGIQMMRMMLYRAFSSWE